MSDYFKKIFAFFCLLFFCGESLADINLDISGVTLSESGGEQNIVVLRDGDFVGTVTVDYVTSTGSATSPSDFGAASGTLNWADGESTPKLIPISVVDDTVAEVNETFTISLSNIVASESIGPNGSLTYTIIDNESPVDNVGFNNSIYVANENGGAVILTVDRPYNDGSAATVDYILQPGSALAGSDYIDATGTVTWGVSDFTSKTINVALFNDAVGEATENFSAVLQNSTGSIILALSNSATVSIADTDTRSTSVVEPAPEPESDREISAITGLDTNQQGTAGLIDQNCMTLDGTGSADEQDFKSWCDNLRDPDTTDEQVKKALDAINPEELTKMGAVSRQVGGLQHQNIERRFSMLHKGGGRGIDLSGLNIQVDGQTIQGDALAEMFRGVVGGASGDDFSRWGLFANGNMKIGEKDASDNNGGYEFDMLGLTVGADYRFTDNLIVGGSVGYGLADIEYGSDSGSLNTDSWSGSIFASYYIKDFYIDGLINYARDNYDSKRRINYTDSGGTIDRTALGDTRGNQLSFGLGSGYDFNHGGWTFGPQVASYYLNATVNDLMETGAKSYNTFINNSQSQSFTLSAGGHISYTFTPSWGVISPYARVDLVHEFIDDPEILEIGFIVDPSAGADGMSMTELTTERLDSNYVNWAAGVTAQFKHGLSGFIDYQTTTGYSGFSIHDISVGVRLERNF